MNDFLKDYVKYRLVDVGLDIIFGKSSDNSDTDLHSYEQAAAEGDADAQFNLGLFYYTGYGMPQDYEQAAYWLNQAAMQGQADALCGLGRMYEMGEGVPQDYAQAFSLYRKAADQGHADAQCHLACMFINGNGVTTDFAQAVPWLRKALNRDRLTPNTFSELCSLTVRMSRKTRSKPIIG